MNNHQINPNVCPSSFNEDGEPVIKGETAHQWDDSTNPMTCSECGATKEPITKDKALDILTYVFDYYLDGADHENQIEVIEATRYIVANLN